MLLLASNKPRTAALGLCALLWAGAGQAGRPLTVDDADVTPAGGAQVEMWSAREPAGLRTWTVSPAIGLAQGVELSVAQSRNITHGFNVSSAQLKVRWTEPQPEGCNYASSITHSHLHSGGGEMPQLAGLVTCNRGPLALHGNLGALRLPHGGRTLPTWGVAAEYDLGAAVLVAETFGQRSLKPAWQLGARRDLSKALQLDFTLGRQNRRPLFSVGAVVSF